MGRGGTAAAPVLTRRQREIASLITEGLTDQLIAKRLFLSVRTVEGHVVEIRNKFGFENRTQIATWFARQSAPAREEPPAELDALPPNNLPAHLTEFVGRHRELSTLDKLLRSARLVTVTGPGGAGKTRLAQQLAADVMRRFRGGVWFVDLGPLADQQRLAATVATTLGADRIQDERPLDTIVAVLRATGSTQRRLLILDNCEHLLDACGQLAEALLLRCGELSIICTSREPLRVIGERAWRLSPMSLPDPAATTVEAAQESDAVRLFVDRAQLIDPEFVLDATTVEPVTRLVHRLDGLPLALELAAGHLAGMSVHQLWQHIDDHFVLAGRRGTVSRQRTLAATIEWSYELLTEEERRHFRRLAVFQGLFSLDAAEAVTAGGDDPPIRLGVLSALIDKSLVLAPLDSPDRYRLFNTIRQYGLERLAECGELDGVRGRHYAFFSVVAKRAAEGLRGAEQLEYLGRVEQAHDDLRSAFDHAVEHEPESAIALALSLERFWFIRGHLSEGRQRITRALDVDRRVTPARGTALMALARLAWRQGDTSAFEACSNEALSIARQLDDVDLLQMCLTNLGTSAVVREDHAGARERYEEALRLARRRGDRRGIAFLGGNLGIVETLLGDHDAAEASLTAALAILRDLDDRNEVANALINLGAVEVDRGRPAVARAYYLECLAILQSLGETVNVAECLEGLACVMGAGGQVERALTLAGAARAMRESAGATPSYLGRRLIAPRLEQMRATLPAATTRRIRRASLALLPQQAMELALSD